MSGVSVANELSADLIARAVSWRHHLHRHPELAFKETKTADFIAERLAEFGLAIHRGLGGTGLVGTLKRGAGQRTIGIRADMDALPIEEKSGVLHASCTGGFMHACGHDGHVAMALAAAEACARLPGLDGTVHFIFQPAEEGECGAKRMIEDGLFRLFPCDAVYALHNQPALPFGACVARDGVMLAACALFEITISGRGCHGGRPHQGTDVILAGCHLVSSLQSIVSRNVDPLQSAVVSATQFQAGDSFNVIPDRCLIRGTARWFDAGVGNMIERRMNEFSKSIAAGFGCEAQVHYDRRFSATINDPAAAQFVRKVAGLIPGLAVVDLDPTTGSEDFSDMLLAVPGCYVWLGAGKSGNDPGLHSPCYDFNDDLLPLGAALWVALVKNSLNRT